MASKLVSHSTRAYASAIFIAYISDVTDEKAAWVVEATRALLPQCEGIYTKRFKKITYQEVQKDWAGVEVKPVNVLMLAESYLTPNGFINMVQELSISGVKIERIYFQSPFINKSHRVRINHFGRTLEHRGFNTDLKIHM